MPVGTTTPWGILFIIVLLTYLIAGILSIFCHHWPRLANYLAHGSAALAAAGGVVFSWAMLSAHAVWSVQLPWSLLLGGSFLRVDALSAFFVLVISLLALAVSVYSLGYVREYEGKLNQGFLGAAYNFFVFSMLLVVTAGDAFMFILVWEVMAVVSFLLVTVEHAHKEVGRQGFIYLVMTHFGTGFIILCFLLFYRFSGDLSFPSFAAAGANMPGIWRNIAFILALIGFGTKAGIVPLHVWLPQAHPAAPSHISALMSGVMIKTGIYGMARVVFTFLGTPFLWWGVLVLLIGAASALLGVLYALMEHDLKRLLAYHSVENIGIILLGFGAAMIFSATGKDSLAVAAIIASMYHLINHALFKGLLFLGSGAILSATQSRDMGKLGGLIRGMPWTAAFFLIGSVSIAALPPFNGFISEWLTFQTLLNGFQISGPVAILTLAGAGALALTGALAAACFVKAFGISFLAQPRSEEAKSAKEVAGSMLAGMGFLAVLCLFLGVFPMVLINRLFPLSVSLLDLGTDYLQLQYPSPVRGSLAAGVGMISPLNGAIALLGIALLVWVVRFLTSYRVFPRRTVETWACGIPRLEALMGYTSTAFSQPFRLIFKKLYLPSQGVKVDYQDWPYFQRKISFHLHTRAVFEEYLYRPALKLLLQFSTKVRNIQAGSVQLYLIYIFITLVLLMIFAL